MAGLQHCFVHGIRFDKVVEYRVLGRWGPRYRTLPLKLPVRLVAAGHGDGGLLSAMQCTALVCQKPFSQVLHWFLEQDLTEIDKLGPTADLRLDGHCVQFEAIRTSQAKTIGSLALQSIRGGQTCMVQFAARQVSRWATAIGVEWQARDEARDGWRGGGQARTLLLLDSQASVPWACGHNARLELRYERQRATGVGVNATVKLRYLGGEVPKENCPNFQQIR